MRPLTEHLYLTLFYKTPLVEIGRLLSIEEKGSNKSTHPAWGGQRYVFVSILRPVNEG